MLQVQPVDELHTVQVEPELAGQATHAAADVAASVAEYEPDPQSVHAAEPVEALYVPAAQAIHGPPLGPVKPAGQSGAIHASLDVLAGGEFAPTGQSTHAVEANVEEYVPGPQSMHAAEPVTLLYFPATHTRHTGQNPVT